MKASELNPRPDVSVPPILPVICDKCRAQGIAGDEQFAGIPDILEFDPVPRRAHVNNWTAEHQRAFIAALALTGSPRMAARALGRHAFGAEQLRKARGGRGFAAAWDAAMDVAREREFARIHTNLKELAGNAEGVPPIFASEGAEDEDSAAQREADEARERIITRLERMRRRHLRELRDDAEKRHAFELLYGPVEWTTLQHREE